jgi:hypothetical protein
MFLAIVKMKLVTGMRPGSTQVLKALRLLAERGTAELGFSPSPLPTPTRPKPAATYAIGPPAGSAANRRIFL